MGVGVGVNVERAWGRGLGPSFLKRKRYLTGFLMKRKREPQGPGLHVLYIYVGGPWGHHVYECVEVAMCRRATEKRRLYRRRVTDS